VAGHLLALEHAPGVWFWPIEPGARCDSELPWVASWVRKLWRLTAPAKPLPMVVPVTSTFCPASNMSTLSSAPTSDPRLRPRQAELPQPSPGLDTGLGELAGHRLGEQGWRAAAGGHLHRAVAVGLDGLHLGDAVGLDLDHGHRHGCAVFGEDAVIPRICDRPVR
jgi:hypothetical protein